jgi:hypothetical protein
MAFARMADLPNVLQAHIGDLVGDAGKLLQETRAHADNSHTLAWSKELQYVCITDLAQLDELLALIRVTGATSAAAAATTASRIRHVSFFLKGSATCQTHHEDNLARFMQHVAPHLYTLEIALGDPDRSVCCEFFETVLQAAGATRKKVRDTSAVVFPKLTSAMITFGGSSSNELDKAFYLRPSSKQMVDPSTNSYTFDSLEESFNGDSAMWFMLGVHLRRLFQAAPTLAHLSVTCPRKDGEKDAMMLLAGCSPHRWRGLHSLRMTCTDFLHKHEDLSDASEGEAAWWPHLRFYQNLRETLRDGQKFHRLFPVLAGLVAETTASPIFTLEDGEDTLTPVPSLRFFWLAAQYRLFDWAQVARLLPGVEIVGVALPITFTSPPIIREEVRAIEDNAWPHLCEFYTNVRAAASFAQKSFQHRNRAQPLAHLTYFSTTSHTSPANAKLALDAKRDELTHSFLMEHRLSTWSGACGSNIQTELADPGINSDYEIVYDEDNDSNSDSDSDSDSDNDNGNEHA